MSFQGDSLERFTYPFQENFHSRPAQVFDKYGCFSFFVFIDITRRFIT